jgi:hypothetical protein
MDAKEYLEEMTEMNNKIKELSDRVEAMPDGEDKTDLETIMESMIDMVIPACVMIKGMLLTAKYLNINLDEVRGLDLKVKQ